MSRRFLVALACVVALGYGGQGLRAQDSASAIPDAIQRVISGQIAAFRADDFVTAFTFASPAIKELFGSPDRFGEMVQSGYPMVWRPADVRFSSLAERDGRMVQSVIVTDQGGALYVLDYEMIEAEGGWQINGVQVRRAGDAGA